jgi:hypothetical protein
MSSESTTTRLALWQRFESLKAGPEKRKVAIELVSGELAWFVQNAPDLEPTEEQITKSATMLRQLSALFQKSLTDHVIIFAEDPSPKSRP